LVTLFAAVFSFKLESNASLETGASQALYHLEEDDFSSIERRLMEDNQTTLIDSNTTIKELEPWEKELAALDEELLQLEFKHIE
jgi:hypothetical protein